MVHDDDMDQKLSELQCPFSWDMDQYEMHENNNVSENFGIFAKPSRFMRFLMTAYDKTMKLNFIEAETELKLAEDEIPELPNYLIDVAKHVSESTKCHMQMKMGNLNEAKEILENIKDMKDEIHTSPLNELKCCAWMSCSQLTVVNKMVIHFARLALASDQNNSNCHFLLAKYLRRKRRFMGICNDLEDEEIEHFRKAFELSQDPQYGLYYAQALKDTHKPEKVLNIYKEIASMKIERTSVQLRLALGFTQLHQFKHAEECFDFVQSRKPEDSTFLHYKSIYFMKKQNFEEAIKYSLKAKEQNWKNYGAQLLYAQCKLQIGQEMDFSAYMINLLETFSCFGTYSKKEMTLHIAFSYYCLEENIIEAIKYFLKAFEIDEEKDISENYYDWIHDTKTNVYGFLERELLPKVENDCQCQSITYPEDTISAIGKLRKYCEDYRSKSEEKQRNKNLMLHDIRQKLSELQCPFTWNMSQFQMYRAGSHDCHDEKFVPELTFMRFLMSAYVKAVKKDFSGAEEMIREAENIFIEIERSKMEMGKHILASTKAHLLMETGKLDECAKILETIGNIKDETYQCSLNEFKAAAWTHASFSARKSISFSSDFAIKYAKLAIEHDENSAVSHFLLAKNLNIVKRCISSHSPSGIEEIDHFTRAYELSKNPQFGMFLADTLRRSRNYQNSRKALQIYREIQEMNIEDYSIQIRLADGFTLLRYLDNRALELAGRCLDYAESVSPEDSVFSHYKGLYLMEKKEYEEALKYLTKTSGDKNFRADIAYVKCVRKLGKRFDFPAYFLNLLKKYPFCANSRQREIYLYAALSYFWIKRDIRGAVKYFLQALEIKENCFVLERFRQPLNEESVNIYKLLTEDLLPKVKSYRESKIIDLSEEIIEASERLEKICEEYYSHKASTSF